jgi:pyruvate/2-oxoglutarate dehydrogenase complex dihydrolipoamide dehydrogenase (E3) component
MIAHSTSTGNADDNAFDVVVIGGGPAGVTAALRACELGASVALVERGRLGGTCTNDGCVPTRVLAKAARLIRDAEQFDDYGLVGDAPAVDFGRLMERTQRIVYKIHEKKQLLQHLQASSVAPFVNTGEARFVDPHTISLQDGTRLRGEKFILCVGGHARRIPLPGVEHALTHSDVWSLKRLPRSVAIVGAAATGCQLASVFNTFGSQVSLLDLAPRLLPSEDEAVSSAVAAASVNRVSPCLLVSAAFSRSRSEKTRSLCIIWRRARYDCWKPRRSFSPWGGQGTAKR